MNFVPLCGTKPGAMSEHPEPRRFPPPWTVVENAASFVVKDAKRQGAPKFDLGPSDSVAEEEGALRWEEEAKFGAGSDHWRDRARAVLVGSHQAQGCPSKNTSL